MSLCLFPTTRSARTTPAHGKAVSSDIQQDNNVVERTWAPEGVTFEKRDVLSRRLHAPAS